MRYLPLCVLIVIALCTAKNSEQPVTKVASSNSAVDNKSLVDKIRASGKKGYSVCKAEQCSIYVLLNNGKVMYVTDYVKEPAFATIGKNVIEVVMSCGSPCRYSQYVDLNTGIKSKPYFMVVGYDTTNNIVAYCKARSLIIQAAFDTIGKPVYIRRDFSPVAVVSEAITSAEFLINGDLVLSYAKGQNMKDTTETIKKNW